VTAAQSSPSRSGLLEKLMAAVRPEFRLDILIPDQTDPVLGWRFCAVSGCDRPAHDYEMCKGHGLRWRRTPGRPNRASFLAAPGPPLRGRSEPASCTVPGCRYGTSGQGLCSRHRDRWQRAGRPNPASWAATAAAVDAVDHAECRLPFGALWADNNDDGLCKSHKARWRGAGSSDAEEFVADCERHGTAFIDFRGLAPQVKLELQYAIQSRHDEQTVTLPLHVASWTINRVKESGVGSLLDRSEDQWRQMARSRHPKPGWERFRTRSETFLIYARDAVESLRDGTGWDVEYPREIWRLHKLNGLKYSAARPQARIQLRFDRIT